MLAWKEQVKCRGLSEHPIDIQVVTKSCNIKLINGITGINVILKVQYIYNVQQHCHEVPTH